MAMTRKRRRLQMLLVGLLALGGATALVLSAFSDNLVFFYGPSDLVEKGVQPGQRIRIGGLVESGSVERGDGTVRFRVTDGVKAVSVAYAGLLPDLFREEQGIVAQGTLKADGSFTATEVLAKHDENYMPPEVADALKRSGHWQHGEPGAGK